MKNELEKIELGINIRVEKTNPRAWIFSISAIDKPTKDYIVSFIKEEHIETIIDKGHRQEKMQAHRELFDENTLVVFEQYAILGFDIPDAIQEFENNFKFPIEKRERFFEWVGAQLYKFMILLTDDFQLSLQGKEVIFYAEQNEDNENTYFFNKFNMLEVLGGLHETILDIRAYAKNKNEYDRNEGDTMEGMPFSTDDFKFISISSFNFDRREYRLDGKFLTIRDQEDRG